MSADRGDVPVAAGGPIRHLPVLLAEVLEGLALRPGGVYCDGTFGAGGYTRAILATRQTRVLALDRDPAAIGGGEPLVQSAEGRLTLLQGRFGDLAEIAEARGLPRFHGVTFDIGVSSIQIDEAARGFSFRSDGPLDMRMEGAGVSAADLVNGSSEAALADIFFHYGEERLARRLSRAIVADREARPFVSTRQLADLAARIIPHKPTDIHPATRAFQALRIAVNDELGQLTRGLVAAERTLAPGGRLAVVTFHSLEDRIVKRFLSARSGRGRVTSRLLPGEPRQPDPTFTLIGRQPIAPGEAELATNPRARSAKLRVAERTSAPARGPDAQLTQRAALPDSAQRRS